MAMAMAMAKPVMDGQQQMKAKHGQEEKSMAAHWKDNASIVDELFKQIRRYAFIEERRFRQD